ncbi:MAG: hypothetical protein AMJ53_16085 [Gammaproteobacteria bacterium SG8_11]|nr:MAG: hypothetical protein AMJ53_16085 [Gammaproteobacteria bacterium SG8_11]
MHNKQVNTSFWMVTLPFNQIFIILQLFFYAVAILGNFVKFHGLLGKIFYLPTYLVNSNLATFVGFHSFLTNKQLHVWERVRR